MAIPNLADACALWDHVFAETGSREAALYAAMRLYSVDANGQVERTPTRYVLEAVERFYSVGTGELLGRARTSRVARARMVAIALLRAGGESYREAGAAVARSKGDAIRAAQKVGRDGELAAEVAEVAALVAARVEKPVGKLPIILPRRRTA